MARRAHKGHDRRRVTILVFAVRLLVTIAAWRTLKVHGHSEVHWVSELAGTAKRPDSAAEMDGACRRKGGTCA